MSVANNSQNHTDIQIFHNSIYNVIDISRYSSTEKLLRKALSIKSHRAYVEQNKIWELMVKL